MKKIILLISILALTFYSCGKQDFQLPLEYHNVDRKSSEFKIIEMRISFTDSVQEFQAEFIDSLVIIEGDIIIGKTEDFKSQRLAVITGNGRLWPNRTIPYTIQSGHPRENLIIQAINEVNSKTNLNLIRRNNQRDYISFINSSGCSSWVGRQGGRQQVTIGSCSFGSIIHEILHAAGFYHEQSRRDRDNFVKILWNNIESGKEHNFKRYVDRGFGGRDINNYDYGSIMHYGYYGFSKNGQKTIDVKIPPANSNTVIGQRNGLSQSDIIGVNSIYPLSTKCNGYVSNFTIYNNSLITSVTNCGIYKSNDLRNPSGGGNTIRLYKGQKVNVMIPYRNGVITAFDGGGIYYSRDGKNLGGGGNTTRLYQGQKVYAMIPYRNGVITAFDGGGIYYSRDGKNLGGGGNTTRLYQGQKVYAMIPYRNGVITAFDGGGIYYSRDGKNLGGGGNTTRLYQGQKVYAMIPYQNGIITAFDGGGIYYSRDGKNLAGGGNTVRLHP